MSSAPVSKLREWLAPTAAAVLIAVVAIVTLVLLNGARQRGLEALQEAKTAEINASAASRDQQISGVFTAINALAAQPWDFKLSSPADLDILNKYRSPDAHTGFFLIDPQDRVTQGLLLKRPDLIGSQYDHPGFAEVRRTQQLLAGRGAILPVGQGLTTDVPVYVLVLPVVDPRTGAYRGSFVAEGDVSAESSFNKEIARTIRGRTDQLLIVDSRGTILAASKTSRLGRPLDRGVFALRPGFHRLGGQVVAVADVPSARWRLIFEEDRREFEESLAQPLQSVGRILLVVLLVLAAGVFGLLVRRLRAAREEQARLRRLSESQEEFISIVSHELRTPVAGILGFLQSGLDHWEAMTDPERKTAVRRAATNARRLQALTRDVLDTESVEAGRMAFNFETVDLVEEVREAVEAAAALYDDHVITADLPPEPAPASADADRIQQVLTNLIDNAVKSSPPGAPVSVSLRVQDGVVRLCVTDRGTGLDPAVAPRVFDKFVRGRGSAVSGTGLGLYVCRLIVEAHHGRIAAAPAAGGGAEFSFDLPLVAPAAPRA
jgi:signal transduction histidine kinase